MLNTRRICAGFLTAAFLAAAPSSWALEPGNDYAPWSWRAAVGDATVYSPPAGGYTYNNYEAISSTTDVDYIIGACRTGRILSIGIQFTNSSGDLDIWVYDLSGHMLAISAGVSDTERVDLSPIDQQAAVMQVVGWHGAQNPYNIQINCG